MQYILDTEYTTAPQRPQAVPTKLVRIPSKAEPKRPPLFLVT